MKKSLNTNLIYVLSITGFVCCCFAGLGFLFSGPAYFIAQNKIKGAQLNPDDYEGNLNAMQTAKTVALIVLIINLLYFAWVVYSLATGDWSEFQQEWQKAMEEMNQRA